MELEPANGGQDYGGLATHGHSGFVLPDREAARMREDVARMYLLGFYRQAGPPAAIAAQIRNRDSNVRRLRGRVATDLRNRAYARDVDQRWHWCRAGTTGSGSPLTSRCGSATTPGTS